ncbi:uncharacterized protein LOC106135353 [Amyelois transitella]|uniref:uncharacterized protein LOC106135353 n=1 Tax=Amyelois transitella TaxID=680683 RepID=UPI00298FD946|nr:uncharacterized protein LOC106135353 [Amyelois transitella]
MDDTQQSRASDAGATRKRRSSILKSQRAPRTPFSELEFNVATPTDTTKSRRVSFSRRTGVAEFITNEATTTWKNFYEEHNKSLESSGNDSAANATRQPIGHIGKRIFDQQFEEVEAVDFVTSLDNIAGRNLNTTNVNFTEQLASMDDNKLPQNNFELSAFTDHHSKIFGDDLAIPVLGEMSGRIDVNFSAVQSIDVKDDLDEIQDDLKRHSNVVGPAPFRNARDFSEYIEVELNSTHAAINNDESDMSITETIRSPKVNVSKVISPDKKSSLNWVDKENNFLEDKVKTLIFDDNADMSITTALPGKVDQELHKKTMIFEDDMADISMTNALPVKLIDKENVRVINSNDKAKTMIFDANADMSITDVLPNKVNVEPEKRRTMIFDDDLGDLSMTKPIPAKLLSVHSDIIDKSNLNAACNLSHVKPKDVGTEKRRTILYEDDLGDLSMTKPIPALLTVQSEIIDKNNVNDFNKSTVDSLEHKNKRRTILFGDDLADLSLTKPIPAKLLSIHSEILEKTNLNDNANKSSVQSMECTTEKRRTILFDDNLGDLSMTKPIPAKLLSVLNQNEDVKCSDGVNKIDIEPIECKSEKRRTVLFDNSLGDLSMTKPIPAKLIHSELIEREKTLIHDKDDKLADMSIKTEVKPPNEILAEKIKSFVEEGCAPAANTNQSMLLTVHSEIIEKSVVIDKLNKYSLHKSQTIVYDKDDKIEDVTITTEVKKLDEKSIFAKTSLRKSQTIGYDIDDVIVNKSMPDVGQPKEMRKTILFDNHSANLSMTKPIPSELLAVQSEMIKTQQQLDKENVICDVSANKSVIQNSETKDVTKTADLVTTDFSKFKSQDVVVYQVATNDISKVETADEQKETVEVLNIEMKQDIVMSSESNNIERKESKVGDNAGQSPVQDKTIPNERESNKSLVKPEHSEIIKDISKTVSKESVAKNASMQSVSKKSILCDLLDMSNASMTSGFDDKGITVNLSLHKPSIHETVKADTESVASEMFYITRDTDSDTLSNEIKEKNASPSVKLVEETEQPDDVLKESEPEVDDSIQKALTEVENTRKAVESSVSFVKVPSTDLAREASRENKMDISRYPRSFSEADNTKELLEMLSDLTDGRQSVSDNPEPITVKGLIAIENKETNEPARRVSIAPNRQSIIFNREDILNNISMAQAALQRSIDIEDSDLEEPTPAVIISPPKKTVRVSNDVVKTLQFEDESSNELSVRTELRSPLKKTAFGETSYMNEANYKANVIPSYLKDVSDGIKALMSDLVKPMNDQLPFETGLDNSLRKSTSTCSVQIQANLFTSSQIDVNNELYSNTNSVYEMERDVNKMSVSPTSVRDIQYGPHSELVSRNLKDTAFRPKRQPPDQTIPGKVLVFDHANPLNNVLLTPMEYTEIHKYCPPGSSQETLGGSDKSHSTQCSTRHEYDVENVSIRYNNVFDVCQSGDTGMSDHQSLASNLSKPTSIDQSVNVRVTEVKDIEVNTAIAMKKNKELLQASSSLTLVDDALARSAFELDIDSAPSDSNQSDKMQKLKVIYKLKEDSAERNINSDITLNDEADVTKAKKRLHSPASSEKDKRHSVTPKPTAKMQRRSHSPKANLSLKRITGNKSLVPERDLTSDSNMDVDLSPSKEIPRKRSPRKRSSPKKEGASITVQQLLTEFNVKPEVDQKVLSKQILDALSRTDSSVVPDSGSECDRSVELVSSFTSSKNQCARPSTVTDVDTNSSDSRCEDCAPDLKECDSSDNVVAKIDMLPFMGSHECEWAPSGTDTWSFRLLHGRIRMCVRLAHRHHNATRTRVRGDTPVLGITVHESLHGNDKHNSVAYWCVWFAAAAARAAGAGCARAGGVPGVLRRAAHAARRALRWGRAMHAARAHLAYSLDSDGRLVFKVANIPLRRVWEVSLTLSPAEAGWPCAREAGARRVLAAPAARRDLRALLGAARAGWGHVPDALWKIFKYLKNLTPETNEMML